MSTPTWKKGDKVRPAEGHWSNSVDITATLTITTVPTGKSRVNYVAEDENGRKYRARAESFVSADTPLPQGLGRAIMVPSPPDIDPGMIVTMPPNRHGTGPWIVLRTSTDGYKCALTKIGGDDGRYLRGVDTRSLTVIDPKRVTIAEEVA